MYFMYHQNILYLLLSNSNSKKDFCPLLQNKYKSSTKGLVEKQSARENDIKDNTGLFIVATMHYLELKSLNKEL